MALRYEFIATKPSKTEVIVDGGEFNAIDVDDAKIVLAAVMRNIKSTGPTKPDAIRLVDPDGQEIWRALLLSRE